VRDLKKIKEIFIASKTKNLKESPPESGEDDE